MSKASTSAPANVVKKELTEILSGEEAKHSLDPHWPIHIFVKEECLSYVVAHTPTKEMIIVDPVFEAVDMILDLIDKKYQGFYCLGAFDTHTHADHISGAPKLAQELNIPYYIGSKAPTQRAQLKFFQQGFLVTHAGPLHFYPTPGHTADSLCYKWGPYLFTGDTILFGDTGRDDLPTGDPTAHFESLKLLKEKTLPNTVMLPGHDGRGGRASTWKKQLELNASLSQPRDAFIKEAGDFKTKAPHLLKESLFENFK